MTDVRHSTINFGIGVLFFCLAVNGSASSLDLAVTGQSTDPWRQAVLALEKTRHGVRERHFEGVAVAATTKADEDALLFLSYLEGRIHHYCSQIYQETGPGSLDNLPCPTNPAGEPQKHPSDPVPGVLGQTSVEKIHQLDQQLNTALGEFDDMLLQEQEQIATHIPKQSEQGGIVAGSGGRQTATKMGTGQMSGGDPGSARVPGGEAGTSNAGKSAGNGKRGGTTQGAGSGQTTESRLPPAEESREVSKDDDDVVARQLREAAEQETDPVVKEKLWQEYRKYKEGIR